MKNQNVVRRFAAWCLAASIIFALTFWQIWHDPGLWVASLVFNLATSALVVFFVNVILVKREDEARQRRREEQRQHRQREAQLASHVITNIMMGCLESILKAGQAPGNTWRNEIGECRSFLTRAARSIRYRMILSDVWSFEVRIHLSQVLLYLEEILEVDWTARPFTDLVQYLSLMLGDVSDIATLTENTHLESQVKACEAVMPWPGISRGELRRATERMTPTQGQ